MLHFKHDFDRCLLSQGIECRNCVECCPMNILGVKNNRITVREDLLQTDCIFCCTCKSCCWVEEDVIKIWDDEYPQLTPVPHATVKLA